MDLITRLAMFFLAVVLAVDGFGATRDETLRVDRHVRGVRWHHGDNYRLDFSGGRVASCDVGGSAFRALADGDVVQVEESRVFHHCRRIQRGDEAVVGVSPLRWLVLLPIALLLAAAFGWIEFRGDDAQSLRRPAW
jgi:hypothetical protein